MHNLFKIFNKKYHSIRTRAFTLVETLVAVSIFSVSVLALMVVLSNSIIATSYAKKKIIAAYLAQEGIEYLRNMRDTYVLYQTSTSDGWSDFKTKIVPCDGAETNGCYFDDQTLDFFNPTRPITDIIITECATETCPYLLHDPVGGRYNYLTGAETDFSRKIIITNISEDEIEIVSTVSWLQGSGKYEIAFSENLFNWTK